MENNSIKKARDVLQEISQDEREQRLTELRQKHIMDQKAIEDYGFDKGLEKGLQQKSLEIAKKLKTKNIEISVISEVTGLTEKEIEKL